MSKQIPNLKKGIKENKTNNKAHSITHKPKSKILNPKATLTKKAKETKTRIPLGSSRKKKKISEDERERRKELRRVKSFIKRGEKRGYKFEEKITSNLATMSLKELVALQPDALYELSTTEKFGSLMTGTEARKIERQLAAQKAAETRARNKQSPSEDYLPSFTRIVLDNIEALIHEYEGSSTELFRENAYRLEDELNAQCIKYGEDVIAHCCEQAPQESIAQAEKVIHSSTTQKLVQNLTVFVMIITGEIPTVEQAKQYGETQDNNDTNWMQNGLA